MFIAGMLLGIGLGIIVMTCMSIGTINDYMNQNEKLLKDYSKVFEENVDLKNKNNENSSKWKEIKIWLLQRKTEK